MIKLIGIASLAVWLGNSAFIDTSGNLVTFGGGNTMNGVSNQISGYYNNLQGNTNLVSGNVNNILSSNNYVIGEGNIVKSRNPSTLTTDSLINENRGTLISDNRAIINDQREIDRQREFEIQRELQIQRQIEKQRQLDKQKQIDRQRQVDRQKQINRQRQIQRQRQREREIMILPSTSSTSFNIDRNRNSFSKQYTLEGRPFISNGQSRSYIGSLRPQDKVNDLRNRIDRYQPVYNNLGRNQGVFGNGNIVSSGLLTSRGVQAPLGDSDRFITTTMVYKRERRQ